MLGASAILLIVKLLDKHKFQELHCLANELGLDVLVEIHDEADFNKIQEFSFIRCVGINNRNLENLTVDINCCLMLKKQLMLKTNLVLVAESGFKEEKDLEKIYKHFDAVLIGTALMQQSSPTKMLKKLTHTFSL